MTPLRETDQSTESSSFCHRQLPQQVLTRRSGRIGLRILGLTMERPLIVIVGVFFFVSFNDRTYDHLKECRRQLLVRDRTIANWRTFHATFAHSPTKLSYLAL